LNVSVPRPQDDDVVWPDDAIEVGYIAGAWGIKGWFKIIPHAPDPQALFSTKRWYLRAPDDRPRPAGAAAWPRLLRVSQAKEHGDGVVAAAAEVPDRNAAEALKGAAVYVSRGSFPTADPNEYYWVDLLGLRVVNREGQALGTVADLLDTGAHSVLRVVEEAPATAASAPAKAAVERLIPFVAHYIDEVDLPGRCIRVDWGLDF
jgi:16S rRNA processing protein RimM